jgi:hypothetical protein
VSTARVDFTRGAAERIARVVRIVEQGDRDGSALRFGKVAESGGGKVFRICTFTGSWNVNSFKTVVLRNSTATVSAYNLFASVQAPCGGSPAAIMRDGTAWYAIAVGCSE